MCILDKKKILNHYRTIGIVIIGDTDMILIRYKSIGIASIANTGIEIMPNTDSTILTADGTTTES